MHRWASGTNATPSADCNMRLTGAVEHDPGGATTTEANKVSMPRHARVLASHKRVFRRDVSAPWLLRQVGTKMKPASEGCGLVNDCTVRQCPPPSTAACSVSGGGGGGGDAWQSSDAVDCSE